MLLDEDVAGAAVPKVLSDNRQGGRLAALHLIEAGHLRFAYLGGPPGLMSARERGSGFMEAIREAGAPRTCVAALHGDYSRRHGETATHAILDRHPDVTALFAGSDEILVGLVIALRERGLRIGADVSVVTFDDAAPLELLDPPVTAIRQPVEEMGRRAIDCVIEAPTRTGAPRVERLPVSLVRRASVAPPPSIATMGRTARRDTIR